MAKITYKAKIRTVYNVDGSVAWRYVDIPKIGRHHCDMDAFRNDRASGFDGIANSDLFLGAINSLVRRMAGGRDTFRLDAIPDGFQVDESGFLAVITIDAIRRR